MATAAAEDAEGEGGQAPPSEGIHAEIMQVMQEKPRLAAVLIFVCVIYTILISGYYTAHHNLTKKLLIMEGEHAELLRINADLASGNLTCVPPMPSLVHEVVEEEDFSRWFPLALFVSGTLAICRFIYFEMEVAKLKVDQARQNGTEVDFDKKELMQYRLDYYFSTNRWAKPILLLTATFVLIMAGAVLLWLASGQTISTSMWNAWTFVADPGTHAGAEGTAERFVSFMITIGGMLVFALMIGIISEFIGEKVDELKKGKSRVIESGHTLMLGWNDKSLAIIQQLAFANESEGGGSVVVLAEEEKADMEQALRAAVESKDGGLDLKGTVVIFRSGNPLLEHELHKVSVKTARAIIALSPDDMNDPDEADSRMVRQVLSLKGIEGMIAHVVVEMQDVDNRELVNMVAPEIAEVIVAHDIIGRLMIQCARQPGLAYVLENLMGFEGSEFYLESWPTLNGLKFGEIICRFDDAVPIGVKDNEGKIWLNPEDEMEIKEGFEILVLAEDNDSYTVNEGKYKGFVGQMPEKSKKAASKEKMLFCGWRRDMADMITQLDEYVAKGSELWLLNTVKVSERNEMLKDKGHKSDLKLNNLTIRNAVGNPIVRRDLLKIKEAPKEDEEELARRRASAKGEPSPKKRPSIEGDEPVQKLEEVTLDEFDSLLILADYVAIKDGADMQSSDSRSLASLLIIQDIQNSKYKEKLEAGDVNAKKPCNPISEILDTRTRSLLRVVDCKGYVMSNQIVSAAIAQVAESREMNSVLGELLSAEGNEPYLRPIELYVTLKKKEQLSFWDVCLRARKRREIAVGYCTVDEEGGVVKYDKCSEMMLNPPDKDKKRLWRAGDIIVVFAQD